ncbi:Mariner Mos1 transposase [Eumeta japonica]|uniref:Mariner Mos1 transposase n=1 Tax=Eumeta variegata TaxID=151549 RepID=A0A4C1SXL0_EUMVA|nr:Mariner Mos1 transposase [Eumeta japonica]
MLKSSALTPRLFSRHRPASQMRDSTNPAPYEPGGSDARIHPDLLFTPVHDFLPDWLILCVWRDWKVIHYELLPSGEINKSDLYCHQLVKLKQEAEKKRPKLTNRKGGVIFHIDNLTPHTSLAPQQILREFPWRRSTIYRATAAGEPSHGRAPDLLRTPAPSSLHEPYTMPVKALIVYLGNVISKSPEDHPPRSFSFILRDIGHKPFTLAKCRFGADDRRRRPDDVRDLQLNVLSEARGEWAMNEPAHASVKHAVTSPEEFEAFTNTTEIQAFQLVFAFYSKSHCDSVKLKNYNIADPYFSNVLPKTSFLAISLGSNQRRVAPPALAPLLPPALAPLLPPAL